MHDRTRYSSSLKCCPNCQPVDWMRAVCTIAASGSRLRATPIPTRSGVSSAKPQRSPLALVAAAAGGGGGAGDAKLLWLSTSSQVGAVAGEACRCVWQRCRCGDCAMSKWSCDISHHMIR